MITNQTEMPDTGFLRLPEVLRYIPVSKTTWWNGVKEGRFPQGVKLGRRTTAWRVQDIQSLIADFTASKV